MVGDLSLLVILSPIIFTFHYYLVKMYLLISDLLHQIFFFCIYERPLTFYDVNLICSIIKGKPYYTQPDAVSLYVRLHFDVVKIIFVLYFWCSLFLTFLPYLSPSCEYSGILNSTYTSVNGRFKYTNRRPLT